MLRQEMEQQLQLRRENVYWDDLIPKRPVTFRMGNCPSLDSLNCEYQMAALRWSVPHVMGNSYLKHSFMSQMSRYDQVGKDIDTNRWGMLDTKEEKYLIKFSGWGTPLSALHQSSIGGLYGTHCDTNEVGGLWQSSAVIGSRRRGSAIGSCRSRKVIKYSKISQVK